MPLLSSVQARRVVRVLGLPALLVLLVVPTWSGAVRLPLLRSDAAFTAATLPIAPRRFGALDLVGVVRLDSRDAAFGGFSAMGIERGRITLLGDGGNWIRFALRDGRAAARAGGALTAGPGSGWEKMDRDSESMTMAQGRAWIGFESANAIWRYRADLSRAEASVRPADMRRWRVHGGAESLVRLPDGRFLAIAEVSRKGGPRPAVLFSGDPTARGKRTALLGYRPPPGYDPVDAATLPSGDLLVLNRTFRLPFDFSAKLVLVPRAAIRAGAVLRGRDVAMIGGQLAENWEAMAVTREGSRVVVWLANDNDTYFWRRSMLAKFVWRA